MPASRHLPTRVFTLVAVLVITLGAAWWMSAEPPAPTVPRSEAANRMVLDLGNGRIPTYVRGTRTAAESTWRCRSTRRPPYHRRFGPGVTDRGVPNPSTTSRFARSTRCSTR
jgi:hypothetical protein